MSLLALPLEILFRIFEFVGGHELRQRGKLLCLSKHWYEIAQIFVYRNMRLSSGSIYRLPPPFTHQVRLLTSHMRQLSITITSFEDLVDSRDVANGNLQHAQMSNLDRSLLLLGIYLSQCTNLEHLTITCSTLWQGCLWSSSICSVISSPPLDRLTSLTLDTDASVFLDHPTDQLKSSMLDTGVRYFDRHGQGSVHICQVISQRLHHLRRLWIRMRSLCPDLINPSAYPAKEDTSKLRSLIINLSFLPFITSTYCNHYLGSRGEPLKKNILVFAKALADHSPSSLETLRVIYPQRITGMNKAVDYVPEYKAALISKYGDWNSAGKSVTEDDGTLSPSLSDASDDGGSSITDYGGSDISDHEDFNSSDGEEVED